MREILFRGKTATKVIRYKGYVTFDGLNIDLNLGNRCQWWKHIMDNKIDNVQVTGTIYDTELLEG